MSDEQITRLMAPFEPGEIEYLTKGGRQFAYVSHPACTRRLIEVFGGDWGFEVVDTKIEKDQCAVLGKLTCAGAVRMQWGGARPLGKDLDLDDILKAAGSYALKKCASLFGVGLYLWDDAPTKAENEQAKRGQPKPKPAPAPKPKASSITEDQLKVIGSIAKDLGWGMAQLRAASNGADPRELTSIEAEALIQSLSRRRSDD